MVRATDVGIRETGNAFGKSHEDRESGDTLPFGECVDVLLERQVDGLREPKDVRIARVANRQRSGRTARRVFTGGNGYNDDRIAVGVGARLRHDGNCRRGFACGDRHRPRKRLVVDAGRRTSRYDVVDDKRKLRRCRSIRTREHELAGSEVLFKRVCGSGNRNRPAVEGSFHRHPDVVARNVGSVQPSHKRRVRRHAGDGLRTDAPRRGRAGRRKFHLCSVGENDLHGRRRSCRYLGGDGERAVAVRRQRDVAELKTHARVVHRRHVHRARLHQRIFERDALGAHRADADAELVERTVPRRAVEVVVVAERETLTVAPHRLFEHSAPAQLDAIVVVKGLIAVVGHHDVIPCVRFRKTMIRTNTLSVGATADQRNLAPCAVLAIQFARESAPLA